MEKSAAKSARRRRASQYPGVAQLVERVVWDHEAAGSKPVTRTKNRRAETRRFFNVIHPTASLIGCASDIRCAQFPSRARQQATGKKSDAERGISAPCIGFFRFFSEHVLRTCQSAHSGAPCAQHSRKLPRRAARKRLRWQARPAAASSSRSAPARTADSSRRWPWSAA